MGTLSMGTLSLSMLSLGCSHVDHHGKCPPPGDCVGYPTGLCAGYYPTCWRLWPAECPSCPVEPASVAVPVSPPPGEAAPVVVPDEGYLAPEQAPPPEIQPPAPPTSSHVPSLPRAGRRLQPIRSRPVPRVDDSTSAGPPPRPIAQAAPRAEPALDAASETTPRQLTAPTAVRVVAEVRPLPPVQEVPAVRPAAVRVSPAPMEWGRLVAELPSAKPIGPPTSAPPGPVMPSITPLQPAVRPVPRREPELDAAFRPTVRAAGSVRR
ncbi:MAG TPA: hypothetical protein VFW87_20005 [Pirellulales bacterium]|nr:hypothetical protein [Pirellulales bacterium]